VSLAPSRRHVEDLPWSGSIGDIDRDLAEHLLSGAKEPFSSRAGSGVRYLEYRLIIAGHPKTCARIDHLSATRAHFCYLFGNPLRFLQFH
jgi:hypothetical protein